MMGPMTWQQQTLVEITGGLPAEAVVEVVGSALDPSLMDGWSDLDLHLRLPRPVELAGLLGAASLWAAEVRDAPEGQVARTVLTDGRRIDFLVEQGRFRLPVLAGDNEVRFLAAMAATKLGRGDQLIGTHLLLELFQQCLVQAMLLRDRDESTTVHRVGGVRDQLAAEVTRLAQLQATTASRPTVVEHAVALYARWRGELESDYVSDWSGLEAVLRLGDDH